MPPITFLSDETLVNTTTENNQRFSQVASDGFGGYFFSWVSNGVDDPYGEFDDDVYLTYMSDFGEISEELRLNDLRLGSQQVIDIVSNDGDVAALIYSDGSRYIKVIDSLGGNLHSEEIVEQGSEGYIFLNGFYAGDLFYTKWVVGYEDSTTSFFISKIDMETYNITSVGEYTAQGLYFDVDSPGQIFGSNINLALSEVGSERYSNTESVDLFSFNIENFDVQIEEVESSDRLGSIGSADVAFFDDGSRIVVWTQDFRDGSGVGGFAKVFDSQGQAIGSSFGALSIIERDQNIVDIAVVDDHAVILFDSYDSDGSRSGVFLQVVSKEGALVGNAVQVNQYSIGNQQTRELAVNGDKIIATWDSYDGDGTGVWYREFELNVQPIIDPEPPVEGQLITGDSFGNRLTGTTDNDTIDGGLGVDTAVYSGNQNSYSLTLSPTGTTIEDRRTEGNGTDTLISIELLRFGFDLTESRLDLQKFGGASGLTAQDFESFIEFYIAYFNRAPDAIGLNFWGTAFANGTTLEEMAAYFIDQYETRATYPDGTSNTEFATAVYNNVLGRTPDQDGFNFWVDMLNRSEETGVTRNQFILEVLRGVQDGSPDRDYLDHKIDVGAYFAVHKGMSDTGNASAAMLLYDGTDTSIQTVKQAIDAYHLEALDPINGEFLIPLVGVLDNPFV